jgi:hypothetical protein
MIGNSCCLRGLEIFAARSLFNKSGNKDNGKIAVVLQPQAENPLAIDAQNR